MDSTETGYWQTRTVRNLPRIPVTGNLDITYRCNNECRHCWLRIPPDAAAKHDELTFDEICGIVADARSAGCRKWNLSGGEPMVRDDFTEILEYILSHCSSCALNTNGTLITPEIARLMKRNRANAVALYGATRDVHDHVTRIPGSFDAMMRGVAYLKEAGTDFMVQIFPMKANFHQYQAMLDLASTLTPHYKLGGAWIFLSASGDSGRNHEIVGQRIDPSQVVRIDSPDIYVGADRLTGHDSGDSELLKCLQSKRDFYVNPYGKMTFCPYIKDEDCLYDLRKGGFQDGWDRFIPMMGSRLKKSVQAENEYRQNCGSCELRDHCRWCPAYAFLEHGRFGARVDYLCEIARETRKFRVDWGKTHRAFFKIAEITIQVDSDLPITEKTFHSKFNAFRVSGPGSDTITLMHHFPVPDLSSRNLGRKVYHKIPWAIYRKGDSWIYAGISALEEIHQVVEFNRDHTDAKIYSNEYRKKVFQKGNVKSLTLFPSDQVLIARILADRQGCYLHSSGIIFEDNGFLFAGASGAGKTTIAEIFKRRAEVLCDDRVIVRRTNGVLKIHGTWSHGDLPLVSANSAPLKAIFFLEKSRENRMQLLTDKSDVINRLMGVLIRPLTTRDWWDKTLDLFEGMVSEIPCYILHFNKSRGVIDLLKNPWQAS